MEILLRLRPYYDDENQGFVGMNVIVTCPYRKAEIKKSKDDPRWRDTEPLVSEEASEVAFVDNRMGSHGDFVCSGCDYYKSVSFTHLTCAYA